MSRMMESLARVISSDSPPKADRPNLQLIRSGIVPSPEAMAELRRNRKIAKFSTSQITVAICTIVAVLIIMSAGIFFGSQSDSAISPVDFHGESISLIQSGNFEAAEAILRKMLAENPNLKAARINYAYTLKAQEKFKEAEAQYLSVLQKHGRDAVALNNLGALYLATGKLYQAEQMLNEATILQPAYSDARLNLGKVLEKSGRLDKALSQYQLYIESANVSPEYLENIKERSRKLHSLSAGRKGPEEKL